MPIDDNMLESWRQMSAALDIMTTAIHDNDGVIGGLQGDAAVGFWGWPVSNPDQIDRAVEQDEARFHRRVVIEISIDQRAENDGAAVLRAGDGEEPPRRGAGALGGEIGLQQLGQDPPGRHHVALPGLAQAQGAGRPVQELDADMLLEGGDGARDGRRGVPQAPPGPGQAALVQRRYENPHGFKAIHGRSILFFR